MANIWCDGFGRYGGTTALMTNGSSSQAWAQVSGWELSTTNPRTGTHHLRLPAITSNGVARRVFGGTLTEVYFGQALYFDALPSSSDAFYLASFRDQTNTVMFSVWLETDGSIYVKGPGGTIIDRTVPVVGAGAYQHFEHYLKVGNSDGAYELRVDEVTRLNLTSIDTDNGAGETSQVSIGGGDGVGEVYMADCYANNSTDDGSGCDDFIGDCKSGILMVNADTAQADFALSAGVSGYDLLNDTPPDDGTYISTDVTTAESNFGLVDGPANLTEILTVRPFDRAWKDDAGTGEIAPSLISNAVKATVSAQPISTAAAYYDSNVPLDPDTSAPWTLSGLNAAIRAVERTA